MEIRPEDVEHPGLQRLLGGAVPTCTTTGEPPTWTGCGSVIDNPALIDWAMELQEVGRAITGPGRLVPGRVGAASRTDDAS